MPKTHTCPFWKWEKGKAMSCEGCRMAFPDDDAKREYIERYCASLTGWEECSIAGNLLQFYERMEQDGAEYRQDQTPGA